MCREPCYCGASDCKRCHPELQQMVSCPVCGRQAPLWYVQDQWGLDCCDQCDRNKKEDVDENSDGCRCAGL